MKHPYRIVGVLAAAGVALVGLAGSSGAATTAGSASRPINATDLSVAHNFGYRLTPPANPDPVIDAEQALAIVAGNGSPPAGMDLVLGHVQSPLGPFDQDAWIVSVPNQCEFLWGPANRQGPNTYLATAYVVLDAATGSGLFNFSGGGPADVARACEP